MHRIRLTATALLATALHGQPSRQTVRPRIPEPYPALSAGLTGRAATQSPDPAVRDRRARTSPDDGPEAYTLYPKRETASNAGAAGLEDLRRIAVRQACDRMFDFGQVKAGWPESECAAPNAAYPGIFFD